MYQFNTVEDALEDIRNGKIVIVIDDEDRENEGDFIMAASKTTASHINFMATHGRGLICTPITSQLAQKLELPLMVRENDSVHSTAFTISIDSISAGTGISCADRSQTIHDLISSTTRPEMLLRPGHIFPLIARDGGVLERQGHTEAAVDLARLAGLDPSGVICEIMDVDGSMAKVPRLFEIAYEFNLKFITIEDLVDYRKTLLLRRMIDTEKVVGLTN